MPNINFSNVAQGKRVGLIIRRTLDRNQPLLMRVRMYNVGILPIIALYVIGII
jgi:hypothetical protein